MSAPTFQAPPPDRLAGPLPHLPGERPEEGWLRGRAPILLVLPFAWSLEDAGWIPTSQGDTSYLDMAGRGRRWWSGWPPRSPAGVGGRHTSPARSSPGSSCRCSPAGSSSGLPFRASTSPRSTARYQAAGAAAVSRLGSTSRSSAGLSLREFAHYHMTFWATVWAAGQFTGYAVFRHRRPFDAVVVTGLLLLADMALTA